jgi:hypothetical protein
VCQGFFITTSGGCLGAFSAGGWGNLGREEDRARFQPFGEGPQAVWGFIRAHRVLPPPIPHLFLGLKVSLPGVVGVPIDIYRLKYCIDG